MMRMRERPRKRVAASRALPATARSRQMRVQVQVPLSLQRDCAGQMVLFHNSIALLVHYPGGRARTVAVPAAVAGAPGDASNDKDDGEDDDDDREDVEDDDDYDDDDGPGVPSSGEDRDGSWDEDEDANYDVGFVDLRLKYGNKSHFTRVYSVQEEVFRLCIPNLVNGVCSVSNLAEGGAFVCSYNDNNNSIQFVPANEAETPAAINGDKHKAFENVSVPSIIRATSKPMAAKLRWLRSHYGEDTSFSYRLTIARERLVSSSTSTVRAMAKQYPDNFFTGRWKIDFIGEDGIDAGGLMKEWVVSNVEELASNLFSNGEDGRLDFKALDERYSCQNTLQRYHLLGVLLAKAITQNVTLPQSTRLSHYIIKHILGCPLTILDLEVMSKEYHKSILDVQGMAQEDIASMDLTFISSSGVPLVPGGEAKTVSSENVAEYIHEMLRHKLFTSVEKQLQEIVRGFTSVIPRALLIPFNPQELELILYGLGTIDVQALKDSSLCSADATNCVEWFWEIFNEYSDEMKARTLHFVTGSSGVPATGLAPQFQVQVIETSLSEYPRAHTCFNTIDIPRLGNKEILEEALKVSIALSGTGFGMA